MIPILKTPLGSLYQIDCLEFLQSVEADSVDLAFADPPFNLGKQYASKINDSLSNQEYLQWCEQWLDKMICTLKPGGALMLWNLPKWSLQLGAYLMSKGLSFRHWIAVDIKYSLPITGRLYPSHYSLLYFVKGDRPAIFHPDRLPVLCCRHCGGELKDYGGYKSKMNPYGVNISDVWTDISPVRHAKYKKREANGLPLKLMDRIISLSTDKDSLVLDPFGGSGTTFVAAELLGRRWLGSELHCDDILGRFDDLSADRSHLQQIIENKNTLFTKTDINRRIKAGNPLSKSYRILNFEDCNCEPDKSCELVPAVR